MHALSSKGDVSKVRINNTDWFVLVDTSGKGGKRFNVLVKALGEKPETFLAKVPGFMDWLQEREGYEIGGTLYIHSTKHFEGRPPGPTKDKFILNIWDGDAGEVWSAEGRAQVDYATLVDPHRPQSILVQPITVLPEASSSSQPSPQPQPSELHEKEWKEMEEDWLRKYGKLLGESSLRQQLLEEEATIQHLKRKSELEEQVKAMEEATLQHVKRKAELEEQVKAKEDAAQHHIDADEDSDSPSEWTQVGGRSFFNIPRLFQKYLRPEHPLPSIVGSDIRRFQRANALRIVSGHGRLLENVSVKV